MNDDTRLIFFMREMIEFAAKNVEESVKHVSKKPMLSKIMILVNTQQSRIKLDRTKQTRCEHQNTDKYFNKYSRADRCPASLPEFVHAGFTKL